MSEVYLRTLYLPDDEEERYYLYGGTDNRVGHPEIWRSVYPFGLLARWQERTPPVFRFEPVTIFCGSNGCGKSTLLNVIAEMLSLNISRIFGPERDRTCRWNQTGNLQ